MNTIRKVFYVLSGEGESGSWRKVKATSRGIKRILTTERCGGDRWAHAYGDAYRADNGTLVGVDTETGELHAVHED